MLPKSVSRTCSKAVVRTESRSLTKNYGEKRAKSGRYGDIFSGLSGRLGLAESGRRPKDSAHGDAGTQGRELNQVRLRYFTFGGR